MASTSAPASSISRGDVNALVRQVNRLLNRQLSSVCQVNGVKSTGIKAELQSRITNLIQDAVNANDHMRFQQIRHSINNAIASVTGQASPARSGYSQVHTLPPPHSTPHMGAYGSTYSHAGVSNPHRSHSLSAYATAMSPSLSFKSSPFYKIDTPVADVHTCEAMSQHRNSVTIPLKLNDYPALQQCVNSRSYRVMLFCAGESSGVQDVVFPHQSELRVNGGEIKANLRGLKNKPGSTRPVDITSALRLRPNYGNNIEFTYALTTKDAQKFYIVLNVCKVTSIEELVARITAGQRIPKDSVIRDLIEDAQDPDVVATSQVLSLKCPISYMRLDLPCRGILCTHIQCFDATSYLQLQEQGPQWLCPICNKAAPFDQLAVDEFVKDILAKTPRDLKSVTIEPNGQWSIKSAQEERLNQANGISHSNNDDDEIEISDVTPVNRRLETPKRPTPNASMSMSSSGGSASQGPRPSTSTSSKRPAAAVIDLTLSSDDEDDEPIQRPSKRQHTGTNGYGGPNNVGPLANASFGYPS